MLGVSVYLGTEWMADVDAYLERVQLAGFSSIFTSLHIPEDDPALYAERLRSLGAAARKYDMELMADISPASLGHLGFTWENAEGLLDWGLTGLRVDYGIEAAAIVQLSKKMKIALNASTLTEAGLMNLKEAGLRTGQVEAWHNFYPRPETGLDRMRFQKMNGWLKESGLAVMAFIQGDESLRGPLHQGLPTLEEHRGMSPLAAYLDLRECLGVDKVLIGDRSLSEKSIAQFQSYQEGIFLLEARKQAGKAERLHRSLEQVHTNRLDVARDCVRLTESRMRKLTEHPISPAHTIERPIGTITIDNEKYGRYQGEVQLVKRHLPADEKVNVIGRIIESDQPLLAHMGGGAKFKIQWI